MNKILTVTFFSGILTLLRMASGFVIAKVVAIYAGPTGIAMLGQVHGLFTVMNGIVAAPATSGVVRYTAENNVIGFDACKPWWSASIKWMVGLFAIVAIIATVSSKQLAKVVLGDENYYWLIIITAITLPLSGVNSLINSVLNGQQKYKKYLTLSAIAITINTLIMIGLVIELKLEGALISTALFMSGSGVVMIIGIAKEPWLKIKYWTSNVNKSHIRGIGGYVIMAIASASTMPVALIIVRNLMMNEVGWGKVGDWQAVYKISEVYLGVITIALNTYLLPKLSEVKGNVLLISNEINKTFKTIVPVTVLLAVMVYLLRDQAINLVFTAEFKGARDFFAVQLLGDVVKICSWIYIYPMIAYGRVKWYVTTELMFSISFVLLAYLLINQYGAMGVSYAYLINSSVCFVFNFLNLKNIIVNTKN